MKTKKVVMRIISNTMDMKVKITDKLSDIGLESLEFMEIIMEIEDALDINIPDGDFGDLSTIGDVVKYIDSIKG